MVEYRSVADLNADARHLARQLPVPPQLVVGVPRSGLLAATLVALHLNSSLTDIEGLLERRLLSAGRRLDDDAFDWDELDCVLVVDDSVNTGRAMRETRELIATADLPFDVEYAAVYITPGGYQVVDYWAEVVGTPRVFGWNVLHHPILRHACVDFDAVVQPANTGPDGWSSDDQGGERSLASRLGTAKSLGWIVTTRPEPDREVIQTWLADNEISYRNLICLGPNKSNEPDAEYYARRKAAVYKAVDAKLFVEGSHQQATAIASRTNRPVYAYESDRMVRGSPVGRTSRRVADRWRKRAIRFGRNPVGFSAQAVTFLTERAVHRANLLKCRFQR
jgi:orotate phosphoribosyltransferase